MEIDPAGSRLPDPISDADRDAVISRLQDAVGDGRLNLEDFGTRVDIALHADDAAELEAATDGLDTAPTPDTAASVSTLVAILGDRKQAGRWRAPRRVRAYGILGDVHIDVREAVVVDDVIDIRGVTFCGNLTVDVPAGVDVELTGFDILGQRELRVANVPRPSGVPLIRIRAYGFLGDIDVRTPHPGETPPSWWHWGRR